MASAMDFCNIGRFATRDGVETDTRMEVETLQYLADTYGHLIHPLRTHSTWKRALYFYLYFMWLALGLDGANEAQWSGVQNAGKDWTGISKWTFYHMVIPVGDQLAAGIWEIVYNDRCAPPPHPRPRTPTHTRGKPQPPTPPIACMDQ